MSRLSQAVRRERWADPISSLAKPVNLMLVSPKPSCGEDTRFLNRLYQAYVAVRLAAPRPDGSRLLPIARFGAFEVRLFELVDRQGADAADVWIELHCYDTRSSLDSRRCQDLDLAESVTNDFVARARELNKTRSRSY